MPVDVKPQILVRRSRPDVAAYMFDPANDLDWTGGITSSRPAQPGPLVAGSTVDRTARFLGRTFTYGYVVTRHDSDRLLELRVERPFPMLVRYELDDAAGGTLVSHPRHRRPVALLRLGHTAHETTGTQKYRRRPRPTPRPTGTVTMSPPCTR